MNKKVTLLFLFGCALCLPACGSVDLEELGIGNGQVESFVDDVSADFGIGPTQTPTAGADATATPTRTPQPTLFPTFTPDANGPILTGAGPAGSGTSSFTVVEVTLTGETYTVVAGDTLGEIAQRFDITLNELFSANQDIITDEDVIEIGWELQIPE